MGADGRIHIWREDKLCEAWPSCDELLAEIRRACYVDPYKHELDGVRYVHLYSATGQDDWLKVGQHEDWETRNPMTEAQLLQHWRLREFVRWLKENATVWEVWT